MERKAYIERLRMLQAFMAVRRAEGVHGIAAGRLVPTRKQVNWQLLDIESEDNDYGESGVVGTTAWKAVEEEAEQITRKETDVGHGPYVPRLQTLVVQGQCIIMIREFYYAYCILWRSKSKVSTVQVVMKDSTNY